MFGSSLPPVVWRRAHVLFTLFVFLTYSGVQHILCCVFLRRMLPVPLECPFIIDPSIFPAFGQIFYCFVIKNRICGELFQKVTCNITCHFSNYYFWLDTGQTPTSLSFILYEEFKDTTGIFRNRKSKKDRKHSGQKDKQRSAKYYTENYRSSNRNPTEISCFGRVFSSCSACSTRHVTLLQTKWYVLNEDRIGLWLRQTEHIRGHCS